LSVNDFRHATARIPGDFVTAALDMIARSAAGISFADMSVNPEALHLADPVRVIEQDVELPPV
jgi:hypothetical protein